jgi:hypothetical protein
MATNAFHFGVKVRMNRGGRDADGDMRDPR